MDHRHVRVPFLSAGNRDDFGPRMPNQNLHQFKGRITRGPEMATRVMISFTVAIRRDDLRSRQVYAIGEKACRGQILLVGCLSRDGRRILVEQDSATTAADRHFLDKRQIVS